MAQIRMIMIAAECAGFAKVGGLADVVRDLSRSLLVENSIDSIAVFLPDYSNICVKAKTVFRCNVRFSGRLYLVKLKYLQRDGVPFYFIHCNAFFGGKYSSIYVNSNLRKKGPFEDDAWRFAFYSKAVLEVISHYPVFKMVNLLHCHDWHTGLLFFLLAFDPSFSALQNRVKTVFTIHNLNYQGIRPLMMPFDWIGQRSFRSWFPVLFQKLRHSALLLSVCYPSTRQLLPEGELKHILSKTVGDSDIQEKLRHMYKLDCTTGRYCLQFPLPEAEQKSFLHRLMQYGCLCFNPMRAAICLADQVNTVSKTYASEITFSDMPNQVYGCGLEHDLKERFVNNRLTGIINGIDYNVYDPRRLEIPFDPDEVGWQDKKQAGKNYLLQQLPRLVEELRMRQGKKFINYTQVISHLASVRISAFLRRPLFIFVGRIAEQKLGILFPQGDSTFIEKLLERNAFFIFTGVGELEKELEIVNQHINAIYLRTFDELLGTFLYGYGDFLLMPSYYEPCGISQLIAMHYGTLPVVHDVGGLHDTVSESENGFKFSSHAGVRLQDTFLEAIDRAIACYDSGKVFQRMQNTATQVRFGWDKATKQYLAMYKSLF